MKPDSNWLANLIDDEGLVGVGVQVTRFPQTVSGVSSRIAGFMAHLRENGIPVSAMEYRQTLEALLSIDICDDQEVRLACKAVCVGRSDHYGKFDELFKAYWFNKGRERRAMIATESRTRESGSSIFRPGVDDAQQSTARGSADEVADSKDTNGESLHSGEGKLIASTTKNLEKVDLRELMTPESISAAEKLAEKLAKAMRDRRSRRRRSARKGATIDMRRVIRASVSHGGEPVKLYRQNRPDRAVNIVALLDVSGSMMVYSRIFLAFLKGLVSHDQRTDAYLFHTALVRVSDALRDHDTLRAVNRLSLMAQGFGGGTRIGSNLQLFNQQYAVQTVTARSVVIILSDGYDTDPPEVISSALQRLKKRGCRIIWLNPLKGWRDYAPVAAGMAAALPHIDLFAAANTLESLAALEPQLGRL